MLTIKQHLMYYVNDKDSKIINSKSRGQKLSFEEKVEHLKKTFSSLAIEEKYHQIIKLGRKLSPLSPEYKTEDRIVQGCQSRLYLLSWEKEEKIYFTAESDALISSGLAAILIAIYSGETAEEILKNSPRFLHELGIFASLSPNRSNGLAQIYLRMKKEAVKYLPSHSRSI